MVKSDLPFSFTLFKQHCNFCIIAINLVERWQFCFYYWHTCSFLNYQKSKLLLLSKHVCHVTFNQWLSNGSLGPESKALTYSWVWIINADRLYSPIPCRVWFILLRFKIVCFSLYRQYNSIFGLETFEQKFTFMIMVP